MDKSERDDLWVKKYRTLWLDNNITEQRLNDFRFTISALTATSEDPILMLINSKGGEIEPTLFFCDYVQALAVPITGIVVGHCASAAVALLQVLNRRLATPRSQLFLHHHNCSPALETNDEDMEGMARERKGYSKGLDKQYNTIIASRSGLALERVQILRDQGESLKKKIFAPEALQLNLIDCIVETANIPGHASATTPSLEEAMPKEDDASSVHDDTNNK